MVEDKDKYVLIMMITSGLQNGFVYVRNHSLCPPCQSPHPTSKMSFHSKFVQMLLTEVKAAILKAATPAEVVQEFATAEDARDNFLKLVLDDLAVRFGATSEVSIVTVPVAPAAESPKEKKKRGPMSDEKKAAMKAKRDATVAAKKGSSAESSPVAVAAPAAAAAAVVAPASPASSAGSPKEKKKRAPMTDDAKAAMKAKRDATLAAKAEKVNLLKVDPTWRKHLKTAGKAHGSEVTKEMEAALLAYLNRLSKDDFNAKKAEEHVVAFLAAPKGSNASGAAAVAAPAAVVEKQPTDLEVVEFEDEEYYVNAETKRVYVGEGEQDSETGGWTSYKPVGYVGMAAFAKMELE